MKTSKDMIKDFRDAEERRLREEYRDAAVEQQMIKNGYVRINSNMWYKLDKVEWKFR